VVIRAVLFPLVESILLILWGTTPGKVAFHISILRPNGEKLRLPVALKRSYASWIRGAFAGIPPIFLIAMIIAYNNYTKHKVTSWDLDFGVRFTAARPTWLSWLLFAAVVIIFLTWNIARAWGLLFFHSR
jgi:uncharacterized RDD family membrane protein YckC